MVGPNLYQRAHIYYPSSKLKSINEFSNVLGIILFMDIFRYRIAIKHGDISAIVQLLGHFLLT